MNEDAKAYNDQVSSPHWESQSGGRDAYAYSNSDNWVFSEQDTLELDNEEVDQLLEVVQRGLQYFLRNLVVSAGSEGRCNTSAHNEFTSNFSKSGDYIERSSLVRRASVIGKRGI
jgi:hypothetical protein